MQTIHLGQIVHGLIGVGQEVIPSSQKESLKCSVYMLIITPWVITKLSAMSSPFAILSHSYDFQKIKTNQKVTDHLNKLSLFTCHYRVAMEQETTKV